LVWGSAAAWRCSTFTKWTEWTLAMTWSWWQHYKYRRGYYYYYYYYYYSTRCLTGSQWRSHSRWVTWSRRDQPATRRKLCWGQTADVERRKLVDEQNNVAVVQSAVYETGNDSVQCMWWQTPLNQPELSPCTITRRQHVVDVCPHRHSIIGVHTKAHIWLDRMDRVVSDLDVSIRNVMTTACRGAPD